ncbi:hypothetical protein EES41_37455 (plasmid) [Streptomyces sp. ADI95-16]|nr:hypothetical protein EES41_37455 [Streptomyces sp. ADI95-16]
MAGSDTTSASAPAPCGARAGPVAHRDISLTRYTDLEKKMGRPESPINPADGPLQRFAHELRVLRRTAGNPSYRMLASRANYSGTSLSEAARGIALPSLDVTLAYVGACHGDIERWEKYWLSTEAELSVAPTHEDPAQGWLERARLGPAPTPRSALLAPTPVQSARPRMRPGQIVSRAGSALRRPATVLVLVAGSWALALAAGLRVKRSTHSA